MRFFDFEVTPNWWLCVLGDLPEGVMSMYDIPESIKDNFIVVNSDMENCRDILMDLLMEKNVCVSGYNIKGYDLIIANAIYQGLTPQQICIINNMIINPGCMWDSKEHIRLQPFLNKKLYSLTFEDLMDDGTGSLKEKEAILGLSVLESSVPFDKEDMTAEDKEDMTYYCKQDVYAAMAYYAEIVRPYCNTKLLVGQHFNIPERTCYNSTNAKIVALALKAKRTTFADADKITIELPQKIREYCYENVPSKILEHIMNKQEGLHVNLFGNEVDYGNGGIHSVLCEDLYVESDDEWMLMNVDAGSYYPSMLIQFNTLTRTLERPELFKEIYDERMRIKHKKDKTNEEDLAQKAYKLILNTTFGASGNKHLDTYDPHQCTKTCRLGQIYLTALACKLIRVVPGLKIIQTNTDGILAYFRRKDLDKVRSLMKEWTQISGIDMEEDCVDRIWQRNVNNYLLVKTDGEIKTKGAWLNDTFRRPGYVMVSPLTAYVSAKAVKDYLINGTDIMKSIVNNKNLVDFAIVCTKGPTYRGTVQRMSDGTEIPLYKCNRVIATKDARYGKIYKYKVRLGVKSYAQIPLVPDHCKTINEDLRTYNFDEIKKELDYMYYVNKAADLLDVNWVELKHDKVEHCDKFNYFND